MKKKLFIFVLVVVALLATTTMAWALEGYVDDIPKDSHKVKTKWDLTGTFVSSRPWGNPVIVPVGTTWTYSIHVKEAMNGEFSKGSIRFTAGDTEVIAHVNATKTNYDYWQYIGNPYDTWENLAAVGWAEYNDQIYNFMFLYSEGAIWIALSNNSYDSKWAAESVWGVRVFDLLSQISPDTYEFDPKFIH